MNSVNSNERWKFRKFRGPSLILKQIVASQNFSSKQKWPKLFIYLSSAICIVKPRTFLSFHLLPFGSIYFPITSGKTSLFRNYCQTLGKYKCLTLSKIRDENLTLTLSRFLIFSPRLYFQIGYFLALWETSLIIQILLRNKINNLRNPSRNS